MSKHDINAEETQRIRDIVRPLITVDEHGVANVPKDWEASALPESLTPEVRKASQLFDINAAAGLNEAVGMVGIDHMAANKDVQSVSYKAKLGLHTTSGTFPRSAEVPAGYGADAGTKTVKGAASLPNIKMGGKSEFQNVRTRLQNYATEVGL